MKTKHFSLIFKHCFSFCFWRDPEMTVRLPKLTCMAFQSFQAISDEMAPMGHTARPRIRNKWPQTIYHRSNFWANVHRTFIHNRPLSSLGLIVHLIPQNRVNLDGAPIFSYGPKMKHSVG